VNQDDNGDDEDSDAETGLGLDKMERMSHREGVNALQAALAYVETTGDNC
jgi:hypothetical protein